MIRPESTTSLEEYHYIKIFIDIDEPYKNVSREREREIAKKRNGVC